MKPKARVSCFDSAKVVGFARRIVARIRKGVPFLLLVLSREMAAVYAGVLAYRMAEFSCLAVRLTVSELPACESTSRSFTAGRNEWSMVVLLSMMGVVQGGFALGSCCPDILDKWEIKNSQSRQNGNALSR